MQPIRIKSGLNVSKEHITSNLKANLSSPNWLNRSLGEGSICIVGGGPSLSNYIDKIQDMRLSGAKVMALNNAHDFLLKNKVAVDFAVLLDARKENADFYLYSQPNITYLIASQAHPDVFKKLDGRDVHMWHSSLGEEARSLYRAAAKMHGIKEFAEIGGGCTVGLRACYLAYAVGFRDIHLFGFDSSFEENHHAYPQWLNDSQDVIEVVAGGETFKTSPTMAKQAYQFQSVVMRLTKAGCSITVHGGGLLPTIHREMQKPIPEDDIEAIEARKYCNMWAFDEYRINSPGERHIGKALEFFQPGSLIDFGCGTGRAAQKFKDLGFDVTAVDHAPNCLDEDIDVPLVISNLWKLPSMEADYGYCTDVMEHIPTDKVDDVLLNISKTVKTCFFNIHTGEDTLGQLIDDELHLTVENSDWWMNKLGQFFDVTYFEETGCSTIFIGETK